MLLRKALKDTEVFYQLCYYATSRLIFLMIDEEDTFWHKIPDQIY